MRNEPTVEWDADALSKLNKLPLIQEKVRLEIENQARKDGVKHITVEYLNRTRHEIRIDPIDGLTILATLLFMCTILVIAFIPSIWETWVLSSFAFLFVMVIFQIVKLIKKS